MTWTASAFFVGSLAILAFIAAFHFSGIIARAKAAISLARHTAAVVGDASLNDDEKENICQQAALGLFAHFATITFTSSVVLLIPAVILWASDLGGLATFDEVSNFLLSWEVILGASLVIIAANCLKRKH